MSRSQAEYVREEPATQPFDVVGLVAGVLFAFVGLAYLIGGHHALSGGSSLVLPTLLVLLGLAGVASSGLVRRPWFSRTTTATTPTTPTAAADDGDSTEDAAPTEGTDENPEQPGGQ